MTTSEHAPTRRMEIVLPGEPASFGEVARHVADACGDMGVLPFGALTGRTDPPAFPDIAPSPAYVLTLMVPI